MVPALAPAAPPLSGVTVRPADPAGPCPSLQGPQGRGPDLACLNRQLMPAAADPAPRDAATAAGGQGVNRLGLYDRAGTAQRLGTNFGKSAFPQARPAVSYPAFGGSSQATPR
jgi:hypothetical protein